MDKKELKLYVTPAQEIVDFELEGNLLDASMTPPNWKWPAGEEDELDDDEI